MAATSAAALPCSELREDCLDMLETDFDFLEGTEMMLDTEVSDTDSESGQGMSSRSCLN